MELGEKSADSNYVLGEKLLSFCKISEFGCAAGAYEGVPCTGRPAYVCG